MLRIIKNEGLPYFEELKDCKYVLYDRVGYFDAYAKISLKSIIGWFIIKYEYEWSKKK